MSDPSITARRTATAGFVLVAVAAALWGSDALFRRELATELPSSTLVAYEHLILAALVAPVLWRSRRVFRAFNRTDWLFAIVIGGGSSALATLLFTMAFRYGDPVTPLLLQKLQPLVAVGGASLILGERVLPRYWTYLAVALAGALLVSLPDPTAASVSSAAPALLAVGAAALWGLGTVLGRHLTSKVGTLPLTSLRFSIGLPVAALLVLFDQGPSGYVAVTAADFVPLLLLALVPGLIALLLYYRGLKDTPASLATLAELAFPLSAVSINYLVFDAQLTDTQWVGIALLTATIAVLSYRSRTRQSEALGVRVTRRGLVPQGTGS